MPASGWRRIARLNPPFFRKEHSLFSWGSAIDIIIRPCQRNAGRGGCFFAVARNVFLTVGVCPCKSFKTSAVKVCVISR